MSKKNELMNEKFNELSFEKKLEVLGVTEDIFTSHRFRGVEPNVAVNDLWASKTNAEKRNLLH
jgi:hypothetical protein